MTLIKSISGIRGTIGGKPGDGLSPMDIVKFVSAFGYWISRRQNDERTRIVLGRDARVSGAMLTSLTTGTLQGLGIDVIDLGLSTTPTVEVAVVEEHAQGGIILTASHNPKHWNALKLLNEKGEFISGEDGTEVMKIAENESFEFAEVDELGSVEQRYDWIEKHIDMILKLPVVDSALIASKGLKIAIDCVNSTGGACFTTIT